MRDSRSFDERGYERDLPGTLRCKRCGGRDIGRSEQAIRGHEKSNRHKKAKKMFTPDLDSRDVAFLDPACGAKLQIVIAGCAARGVKIVPYFTVRGPIVQAKLWCQSRPVVEIAAKRSEMILGGAPMLAALLLDKYAACGRRVTNAPPGLSWHQWAKAADCFIEENGCAVWNSPLYKSVYAEEGVKAGLTAGADWPEPKTDSDHLQDSHFGSPLDVPGATWATIEAKMAELFEGNG